MWKEEYRIGVELIDIQHRSLFAEALKLSRLIESGVEENKMQIMQTILFLKNYALNHFRDEESYQISIGYADFEMHQAQHKSFIMTLLQHEKLLKKSYFAENEVKALMDTLVSWLVFHVANSDQKIVGKSVIPVITA